MTDDQITEHLEELVNGLAEYLNLEPDDVRRVLVDSLTGEHKPIREVHRL